MVIIAILLVKMLDPVSFIVVLMVSTFSREKWIIPVAAIIGAIVTETVLTSTQNLRIWGEGIIFGVLASGVHAVLSYWLIGKFKKTSQVNPKLKNNKRNKDGRQR